jgi:phosphoribosyl 1,2-cyclic phosphodiesterase
MSGKMRLVTLASGSKGNCTLISGGEWNILIDAGISMRRIKQGLALCGLTLDDVDAILITHEHSDHVSALPMLAKHCNIPIYAPRTVAGHLRCAVAGVENSLREIPVGEDLAIGGATVRAFHTPHDTDESVGYRISGECVFAIATDMGHVTEEVESGLLGADAVMIEANHDPDMLRENPRYPYPLKERILSPNGHLSNGDCAKLAARLADNGARYIVLGHLSRENNTPALACRTVGEALKGRDVFLCAAPEAESLSLSLERSGVCCL